MTPLETALATGLLIFLIIAARPWTEEWTGPMTCQPTFTLLPCLRCKVTARACNSFGINVSLLFDDEDCLVWCAALYGR